ncbi:hypothetical protein Dda_6915 [Drechslerella dactyloides]|uniref:Uncharacterized protein n=1 Tax=Drechslerella dactyloides TaxID=74499 RepID=A0AAD6ISU3_DREDA|nr:hypothetical protein Dda_6915 [Drechslerella dactyloides]
MAVAKVQANRLQQGKWDSPHWENPIEPFVMEQILRDYLPTVSQYLDPACLTNSYLALHTAVNQEMESRF